jgi:hypothetical protein
MADRNDWEFSNSEINDFVVDPSNSCAAQGSDRKTVGESYDASDE